MNEKTIDKIRNAGGRMVIGTPDDQSNVTTLMPLGNILYAVKEKGIYAIKLADDIDPARTNPAIPHVQQRIVALGSDSPLVGQTLLTAKELFSDKILPNWFDCTQAILCSLEALKDLAAVCELKDSFTNAETKEIAGLDSQSASKGSLILPAIGDVDARCKTFFQKADHASRSLLDIVKLFYKKLHGIRGMADLIQYAKKQYGEGDSLVMYLESIAPTLRYVRDTRNCLEHPNPPAMQANISDFSLRPDGIIARPSIEVIAGREHYPAADISAVMTELSQTLPQIFEGALAYARRTSSQ
ncbi:MAG: hypothetical protein ABS89_00180 [Thiobacillus sp. SCN 63-1177]|nr:MAG: hypothetical protein ABS89_00180 [Thiobacillus sp. SCN 63-1177]